MVCGFADGDAKSPCPRPTRDGGERCPLHAGRGGKAVPPSALRAAVCADLRSDDERRLDYHGLRVDDLDLSGLSLEHARLGALRFRDCTVEGTVDLSGSAVDQPVVFEGCTLGRLDASDADFAETVAVADSRLGAGTTGTCLTFRRAAVEGSLSLDEVRAEGSVEFASLAVEAWLELDGVSVTAGAHFPNATIERGQVVDTAFGRSVQFTALEARQFTVERVTFEQSPRFDDARIERLRFRPAGDVECHLVGATVEGGRLDQPDDGRALYDLTDAVIGDLDIDCASDTLDRYRFYRTRYDGFPFAAYRTFLRENRWAIHEYAGDPETEADRDGLERTYLEARHGAGDVGDHENAQALFLREMRYRRRRYATHIRDSTRPTGHRVNATVRWVTSAFLNAVSGYGERPQRTVLASVAVILGSALVYPAVGGLRDGETVVTFTTPGYGDLEPTGALARTFAGVEALSGAFLVALFVFALGRQAAQ